MTAPTSTPAPSSATLTPTPAAACDVCAHPATAHDVIGRRFCDATLQGALTRGLHLPVVTG